MQPYLFPYQTYFDLIGAVNMFVFLTDVQYIRRGWVNRNRIRSTDTKGWQYITIPVHKSPRETHICDVKVVPGFINGHLKKLDHEYGRKALSHPVVEMYKNVSEETDNLCDILITTVSHTSSELGLNTWFSDSTKVPLESRGQERIIQICKYWKADTYVNLPGGRDLYDKESFAKAGIALEFMDSSCSNNLSMLDVLLKKGE